MIKTTATTGPQRPRMAVRRSARPVAGLAVIAVVIAARRIATADLSASLRAIPTETLTSRKKLDPVAQG